jgi:hypothetical protein
MKRKLLTAFLSVRLTPERHTAFYRKADQYGRPSDLLRELVEAFIDDRLTIKPPSTVKKDLYVNLK